MGNKLRVIHTKQPSTHQMKLMSINLQRKLRSPSSVEFSIFTYNDGSDKSEFRAYSEHRFNEYFKEWDELLDFYERTMKDE